jgi:hypothetical protein
VSNFYTAKKAAIKIGISYSTMISIIKREEITYSKIGKRKKFSDEHITDYLNKNKAIEK